MIATFFDFVKTVYQQEKIKLSNIIQIINLEQKRIERLKNTQEADNKNTIEEIESSLELFDAQKDSVEETINSSNKKLKYEEIEMR